MLVRDQHLQIHVGTVGTRLKKHTGEQTWRPGVQNGFQWCQQCHRHELVGGDLTILKNMKVSWEGLIIPYICGKYKLFETTKQ